MSISIITNFKVNTYEPIDDRLVATNSSALSTIPFPYEGLTVYTKQEKLNYTYNGQSWQVSSNGIYGGSGSLVGDTDINTGVVLSILNSISNDFILSASSSNDSRVKYITRFRRNENNGSDYETVEVLNQIRYLDGFSGDLQGPYISFNKQDIKKGIISFGTPTRNIQNNIVVERLRIEPDSTNNQGAIVLSPGTYSPPFYFSQMSNGNAFLGFNWDGTSRVNFGTGSSEIRFNGGRIQFLNGGSTPTNQQFLINEPNSQNNSDILLRVDTSSRDMSTSSGGNQLSRDYAMRTVPDVVRTLEHRYTKLQAQSYVNLTGNRLIGNVLYVSGDGNFFDVKFPGGEIFSNPEIRDIKVRRIQNIFGTISIRDEDLPEGTEITIRFTYNVPPGEEKLTRIYVDTGSVTTTIRSSYTDTFGGEYITILDKTLPGDIFTFRRGMGYWYVVNVNRESSDISWSTTSLTNATPMKRLLSTIDDEYGYNYSWQNLNGTLFLGANAQVLTPIRLPYSDNTYTSQSSNLVSSVPLQVGKAGKNVYIKGSFRILNVPANNLFRGLGGGSMNKFWIVSINETYYFPENEKDAWGFCEVLITSSNLTNDHLLTNGRINIDAGGRVFVSFSMGSIGTSLTDNYSINVNIPQFSWKTV